MRKAPMILLVLAFAALGGVLAACGAAAGPATHTSGPGQPRVGGQAVTASGRRQRHVATARQAPQGNLTLAQLAGERVIYAYAGLTPPKTLLTLIRAGEAAGVILFSNNIASVPQIRAVVRALQAASAMSPLRAPLLILTDQEGGEVRRLPGAPTLSERQIGERPNGVSLASGAGTGAANTLRAAAVNVNLAPVLDVFRRHGNFIDTFQRSYSSDPAVVAKLGAAFISSQQERGVAATAKHFPGLGAATGTQNTDAAPVVLPLPLTQLRRVDELPYRAALAAGVKLVMTSWAVYPALDAHLPAGLSPAVIQGELRHRIGFTGITISDAITAGALARFGSLGQRGLLAARAGEDLIICSETNPARNTPADGVTVLTGIESALTRGQLSRPAARQAAAAVLALRRHL